MRLPSLKAVSALITMSLTAEAAVPMSAGDVIWGDLRYGMTAAEVHALHSDGKVELTSSCEAYLYAGYNTAGLWKVVLQQAKKSKAPCGHVIHDTLEAKYGPADDRKETVHHPDCGNTYAKGLAGMTANLCKARGGDLPFSELSWIWYHEKVKITLILDTRTDVLYVVAYEPISRASDSAAKSL